MHAARINRLRNTLDLRARRIVARSLPYSIQLEVTTKCNLACIMCARDKYHGRGAHLDDEILERTVADLFPTAQDVIVSSFGEPLLYPDLERIFQRIDPDSGLELGFFTNLLPLTEPMAERIVRGGVAYLNVSIDGATKETYETIRKGGKWETLLEKLALVGDVKKRLGSETPHMNLCVVGSTLNVREIPLFVEMARRWGFDSLKYNHNLYVDDESMEALSLVHAREETAHMFRQGYRKAIALGVRSNFDQVPFPDAAPLPESQDGNDESSGPRTRYLLNSLKHGFHVRMGWRLENTWAQAGGSWSQFAALFAIKARDYLADRIPLFLRPHHSPRLPPAHPIPNDAPPETCGNPWTHAHVKADGLVYPCCFSPEVMGDLRTESFPEIWNGQKYQSLRRSLATGKYWATCRKASCNWVKGSNSTLYGCKLELVSPLERLTGAEGGKVAVRVENTGRFPWLPPSLEPGPFVSLGYRLYDPDMDLVDEGVHVPVPRKVLPGQSVEMELPIAPTYFAGPVLLKIDMIHEGTTWFGERGNNALDLRVEIDGVPFAGYLATWNRAVFQDTLSHPLRPGQTMDIPIRLRNAGTAPLGSTPAKDFLSTHWRTPAGEWIEWEGIRTEISPPLDPGEVRDLSLPVRVPESIELGDCLIEFDVVRDEFAWLRCLWNRALFAVPVCIGSPDESQPPSHPAARPREVACAEGRFAIGHAMGQCVADPRGKGIW